MASILSRPQCVNGNTFRLIIKQFTFGNITGSDNCLVIYLCSSIMIVIYCLLSVGISPNTRSAVIVFHILYAGIIFWAMQGLNCGGIPVEWLRKYAMIIASIVSDFGDIFLIFLSIALVFGSLLHHLLGFDILHNLLEMSLLYLHSFYKSFLLLMNIEQNENLKTNYMFLIQIFHIAGYFTIVVLLFNIFIASMVKVYNRICSNCSVYSIMHGLDVVFRSQDGIPPIINRLYCHCLYKAFVVEGYEVYVVRLTNINKSNLTVLDHDIE